MRAAILLALWAAGCPAQPRVEGKATNALTGQPLAGVHVHLRTARLVGGFAMEVTRNYAVISGEDGHFSMSALAAGDYELSAERNGYVATDPVKLTVKAGENRKGLELKMTPSAAISGRVLDGEGEPVTGLLVKAIRGDDAGGCTTNDDGEFRIPDLAPGKYLLLAWRSGPGARPEIRTDGTKEINYGPTYYPGVLDLAAAVAVEVKSGAEVTGLEIRLMPQPILHISGRVNGPHTADTFVGAGVAGTTRVGADGTFTLWRVPPGSYSVASRAYVGKGGQSAPVDVQVSDASVDDVVLQPMEPFSVDFRVEGWDGRQGSVKLQPMGRPEGEQWSGAVGATGAVQWSQCWPALYQVTIPELPANSYIKRVSLGAIEGPDGLLDLRGGEPHQPVTIELATNAARVSGTVTDSNGPVPSALVALFPAGKYANERRILGQADVDGKYYFGGLAPGKYAILALAPREPKALAQYDEKLETVDVKEGETAQQDVKLK